MSYAWERRAWAADHDHASILTFSDGIDSVEMGEASDVDNDPAEEGDVDVVNGAVGRGMSDSVGRCIREARMGILVKTVCRMSMANSCV